MANLLTRDDTFLGVCEALGEDLLIPATVLRLGFTALLFFNPPLSIGVYLALGALVALTRWVAPNPRIAPEAAAEPTGEAEAVTEQDEAPLPIAA